MQHKIGLALGGGGARGSYQIGILKALKEAQILDQIYEVSGTSIGAINTLMVIANLTIERMHELWMLINNHEIYGSGLDRYKLDKLGMFSIKELYEKLAKEISIEEIRESKIHGYATAAKLKKQRLIDQILIHRMKKEVFYLNEAEEPHRAVLASASIPVIFGSTEINDQSYVDGGALDNCPIDPLIEAGCDIILAVPIDGMFKSKKYKHHNICLINFEPNHLFKLVPYDILDFKPEMVEKNAEYGYQFGKLMIEKLKKLKKLDGHTFNLDTETFDEINLNKDEESVIDIAKIKDDHHD
ncbi:MAG: patatin-like phospholipase family protein [Acholeplasmataceae bacterium]